MPKLRILPLAFDHPELLKRLREELCRPPFSRVTIIHRELTWRETYNRQRGQYHSSQLLRLLCALRPEPEDLILAVTGVDLFIPILTFVFGEAHLGGNCGIISGYRLDNSIYGIPAQEELLFQRLLKEARHELGHNLGLVHCREPGCVMNASTTPDEIDLKEAEFCPACREQLTGQSPLNPLASEPPGF